MASSASASTQSQASSSVNSFIHHINSVPLIKTHQSSFQPSHLSKFNSNLAQNNFILPNNINPSSSTPPHLSLFDFHPQDIHLYDSINSHTLPLTAPLPQSINLNKSQIDHLSLSLQDHSSRIQNLDRPHTQLQENDSFELYPHHQSHPAHQGTLNQFPILSQSSSTSQAGIHQPHSSSSAISSFTSHPSSLLSQPPLQNALPLVNSIETHPSSSRPDTFDSNDLGQTSAALNSLDSSENGLPVLLLNNNSQSKIENQHVLEPLSNPPISPFEQFTPVALSEQSNGSPHLQTKPPKARYNGTTTGTLSQDFRKRKDWIKRLVEDIEDVIQVVTPTGELLFLTETMSRLTGFQTSELVNSKLFDWCFEEEDCANLKREMKNCALHGNQLNLYCRFKKKNSDGFVILEMVGHMIDIQSNSEKEEEKRNKRAIFITARVYPTSCAQLMDNFLELLIDNEMLTRKLQYKEQGLSECSEVEAEEEEEKKIEEGMQKRKNNVTRSTRVGPIDEEDDESEDENNGDNERLNHQIIGRNYPSKPRKRSKKDKSDFLCLDCGVTQSPEWRKGPMGRKTLCNACGLRYAKKGQVMTNNIVTNKK